MDFTAPGRAALTKAGFIRIDSLVYKNIMRFLKISFIIFAANCSLVGGSFAQSAADYRLKFREGDIRRAVITEVLRQQWHFPQVSADLAKPSIRTSKYFFTETIERLTPGGGAVIGATLDSFQTGISMGETKDAESFFKFNSNGDWDISHEFHDIKVLPRAQFLGNTLRFTMNPDGTIANFLNLQGFHENAIGKGYDYDMVHAMLSLTDSLRMGQLLEFGFGGLAAVEGPFTSPSTATEIHLTRTVSATEVGKGILKVHSSYFDAPKDIDYLEGIATPLGILSFYGAGSGEIAFKDGYLKHSVYNDTANIVLKVDIDTVPEEITRTVTTDIYPIPVLRGGKVTIKEIQAHHGKPKEPDADPTENPADSTSTRQPEHEQEETRNQR